MKTISYIQQSGVRDLFRGNESRTHQTLQAQYNRQILSTLLHVPCCSLIVVVYPIKYVNGLVLLCFCDWGGTLRPYYRDWRLLSPAHSPRSPLIISSWNLIYHITPLVCFFNEPLYCIAGVYSVPINILILRRFWTNHFHWKCALMICVKSKIDFKPHFVFACWHITPIIQHHFADLFAKWNLWTTRQVSFIGCVYKSDNIGLQYTVCIKFLKLLQWAKLWYFLACWESWCI